MAKSKKNRVAYREFGNSSNDEALARGIPDLPPSQQNIRHLLLLQYWTIEQSGNKNHWRAEILGFRTQLRTYLTTNLHNYLAN